MVTQRARKQAYEFWHERRFWHEIKINLIPTIISIIMPILFPSEAIHQKHF